MKMKRVRQASKYLLKCLDPCCYELRHFGDIFVTIRDHSIYGREYWSDGNLIGKQRLNKTLFFPYLIVLAISVTPVKQRGRTFALKIRFEQNDSIPPSYQFKREDMRLNLHCEFVDWIEAFQLKKASLIAANLWLDFIFNVIQWRTLYMIFVPFTRISNLLFSGKKIALS